MSSILDALNRSDAERRRGQPPTLGSPTPFATRRRGRPPWLLPALAAVALTLAWWVGMFDFGAGGDTPSAERPPQVAGEPGEAAIAEPAAVAPVPPSPADGAPPVADRAPASPEDGQMAATDRPPTAEPGSRFFGGRTQEPPAATPPAPVEGTGPDGADGRLAGTPAESTALAPAPAPAPVGDSTPVTPSAAAEDPAGAGPARLHELPFAVRRGLPALAVTMHMYSADPARRFALVNGIRVHDGESLPGGVEVLAIRADGILVRFEGTEFVLPVRS
ncbi:MAG: general secretion pathway protein GspB [Xanthomonadales bacterium]|nr:general secretion pathway protein GspB [Xanthomonadales bacterium]